ncbi:MAG: QueT transporter family protein [Clostridiales bacterium]|nr:QueT transporter family protein [Clostridiales bacterium]
MKKTSALAFSGLIGAMYIIFTIVPALIPGVGKFLYGNIQFRISEALCILPFFIPSTAWGLFIGCMAANFIGTTMGLTTPFDIVIGSLTTLMAALITTKIKMKWLVPLPTVLLNAVVIGTMLAYLFPLGNLSFLSTILLFGAQVGFGELVVCYGLGMPLLFFLERRGLTESGFKPFKHQ